MIDYLRDLLGVVPVGFGFLEYIFGFVLVLCGLFLIYKVCEAFVRLLF